MDTQQLSLKQELYEKRQKIYPRQVSGIYATLRVASVFVLLGLYYLLPWASWDGRQAVLFDLPARKFHLFGLTLWPQDFIYLAALLIIAALSLFFFTALAGRLWCGYACPQTVWTEVFLWIERKVEGNRNQRIKLDKLGVRKKWWPKTLKHILWIILSLWTGYTFVGYFTPVLELGRKIIDLNTGPWETFWVLFYGFATYGNAGWMREQVCIYMCPYARFQSAMFDQNTLMISYDAGRGDPKGSRRRLDDPKSLGLGDCIDCQLCVQVCPTGIDIRDGLQYQCIGCAACIDVCDDVMDKMRYPKGLIRYTTENALEHGTTQLFRPRILVYSCILIILSLLLVYGLIARSPVALDVIKDRNVLYRQLDGGEIENIYTLKILNKDSRDHQYQISISGLEQGAISTNQTGIYVVSGKVASELVSVSAPADQKQRRSSVFTFQITAIDDPTISAATEARFLNPVKQ